MNWHDKTIAAYDNSAQKWSDNFKNHGYGPRYIDIERALTLARCNDKSAKVIEIGCGDGRDAQGIVENVSWYEGFDPYKGLLELAKAKLPETNFVLADAQSYVFPSNIDVIFAFASLLHINKHDLSEVFKKFRIV